MVKKINLFTDVIGLLSELTPGKITSNYSKNNARRNTYDRSLRSKSGDFILQFPLVTSSAIDPDTIELIRNQLELERAYEFDFVLTNTPLQLYNPNDPNSFMSNLHNNINFNESTKQDIRRANEYLLESPEDKLNMDSINDMTIAREEMKALNEEVVGVDNIGSDGYLTIKFDGGEVAKSLKDGKTSYDLEIIYSSKDNNEPDKSWYFKGLVGDEIYEILARDDVPDSNKNIFTYGSHIVQNHVRQKIESIIGTIMDDVYKNYGASGTKILNTDKLNSSIPLTIQTTVSFREADSKGRSYSNVVVNKTVKFGVKTVVHPVRTEDVIFYLSDKSKGSNLVSKLIKFSTGELRLFKDLLLDTEKVKEIAKNTRKGRSGNIWNKLNSLYTLDRAGDIARSNRANYIPTTALLTTVDELEEVKRKTGVDILSDRRAAKKIYKEFFLLELLVIDQAREILYKFLPEHNKFEVIKLNKLGALKVKNDSSKEDLDFKKLKQLLK